MNVFDIRDIVEKPIVRFTSTFDELDWAYGRDGDYGVPAGMISLWAGQSGVGKTRLLVQMMKQMDVSGMSSLIFQGETSPAQFKSEKMSGYEPKSNIWVSPSVGIDEQIDIIADLKPRIVITDSVQQIEEYRGGHGAKEVVRKLRSVIESTGTHVFLISQLTKDKSPKGGTELPHEVDVVCNLMRDTGGMDNMFIFSVEKNRFGPGSRYIYFTHRNWGVECETNFRLKDPSWSPVNKGSKGISALGYLSKASNNVVFKMRKNKDDKFEQVEQDGLTNETYFNRPPKKKETWSERWLGIKIFRG